MKLNMQQIFHYSKELNLLEATHLLLLLAISGCMGLQVTSLFKADITQWVEELLVSIKAVTPMSPIKATER